MLFHPEKLAERATPNTAYASSSWFLLGGACRRPMTARQQSNLRQIADLLEPFAIISSCAQRNQALLLLVVKLVLALLYLAVMKRNGKGLLRKTAISHGAASWERNFCTFSTNGKLALCLAENSLCFSPRQLT